MHLLPAGSIRRRANSTLNTVHLAVLLPNAERAEIDPAKLRDYLLSRAHRAGRFKARFFSALGFTADGWRQLEAALRTDHLTQPAEPAGSNERGEKFAIGPS